MPLELAAAATLALWLYLIFFRGAFWREFLNRNAPPEGPLSHPPRGLPRIAAVIPARNEAPTVVRAVRSLAAQHYRGVFHMIVVDDDSTDDTAAAARAAATPDVLTVVHAAPLPAGWTGKLWALSEGIRHSARFHPDYLLLTDADIVHSAGSLDDLAARANAGPYDLVSFMATLQCRSPAERALVPAFVFFFFLLYPPAWIRNPRRSTAGAAGGCMLVRQAALGKIGGIEPIRGSLIDDCALASAIKRSGGRIWLGLNPATISIRSYGTFGEIGRMISRTAFTQLRHSPLLLFATITGLTVAYLLPPVIAVAAPQPAAGMAATAWLAMAVAYYPALRFYNRGWFAAPLLPLAALFYLAATIHSAISYWLGSGGRWKGRIQDKPA
ncbi:MAG: glycosyltransferase [Bryobacteraceae bacterium]|jgi:hopene-associated glycosyltransferase HpnB